MPPLTLPTPADILWKDDVPTSRLFDDVYFSRAGGLEETHHVFLNANHLAQRASSPHLTIAETGFGTGLNFLAAWQEWKRHAPTTARLTYISTELYPLTPEDMHRVLSHWPTLTPLAQQLLTAYPPCLPGTHRLVLDEGRVILILLYGDMAETLSQITHPVDLWFLDGFSPAKNPQMWQEKLYTHIQRLSHPGTSFATFTAAGAVKRGMESIGFTVEKHQGFGHKRDMLVGTYNATSASSTTPLPHTSAIVLGAGIAGCFAASELARQGTHVTLIDRHPTLCAEASGNPGATLMPYFTLDWSTRGRFYAEAYSHALTRIRQWLADDPTARASLCGAIALDTDEATTTRHDRLSTELGLGPDILQRVTPKQASDIAGIPLTTGGLYYPHAGWIHMQSLCEWLLTPHPTLTRALGHTLTRLEKHSGLWHAYDSTDTLIATAEAAVIASAYGYHLLARHPGGSQDPAKPPRLPEIPLEPVRGQLCLARPTPLSSNLKTVLSYGGYILPAYNGEHVIGSTFQRHDTDHHIRDTDTQQIMQELANTIPALSDIKPHSAWAALRCASRTRMPHISLAHPNEEGLYFTLAHGSKGVLSGLSWR